jgi:hypothetical protein
VAIDGGAIVALGGNDTIRGRDGNDLICAGAGMTGSAAGPVTTGSTGSVVARARPRNHRVDRTAKARCTDRGPGDL